MTLYECCECGAILTEDEAVHHAHPDDMGLAAHSVVCMLTLYCDNPGCEAEATETVPVSVHSPADEERHYCYTCYEAYLVGVQHGKMISGNPETLIAKGL